MNEKKFNRIIKNPRHIPGIFNYCDRWCERCHLTLRCSVFAMEEAMNEKTPHDREQESLWPRLAKTEPTAAALLQSHSGHAGVGIPKDPIFKNFSRSISKSTLGAAAKRYMEFAHRFVKDHQESLPALTAASDASPVSPAEAFEIIAYYHLTIPIKLSRAVQQEEYEKEEEPDEKHSDSVGSAKISLILIDRSILAWAVLAQQIAALRDQALSAMATLARLRIAIEKHFPQARAFVRPGFDTLRFEKQ